MSLLVMFAKVFVILSIVVNLFKGSKHHGENMDMKYDFYLTCIACLILTLAII